MSFGVGVADRSVCDTGLSFGAHNTYFTDSSNSSSSFLEQNGLNSTNLANQNQFLTLGVGSDSLFDNQYPDFENLYRNFTHLPQNIFEDLTDEQVPFEPVEELKPTVCIEDDAELNQYITDFLASEATLLSSPTSVIDELIADPTIVDPNIPDSIIIDPNIVIKPPTFPNNEDFIDKLNLPPSQINVGIESRPKKVNTSASVASNTVAPRKLKAGVKKLDLKAKKYIVAKPKEEELDCSDDVIDVVSLVETPILKAADSLDLLESFEKAVGDTSFSRSTPDLSFPPLKELPALDHGEKFSSLQSKKFVKKEPLFKKEKVANDKVKRPRGRPRKTETVAKVKKEIIAKQLFSVKEEINVKRVKYDKEVPKVPIKKEKVIQKTSSLVPKTEKIVNERPSSLPNVVKDVNKPKEVPKKTVDKSKAAVGNVVKPSPIPLPKVGGTLKLSEVPMKRYLDQLPEDLIARINESGKRKPITVIPAIPNKKRPAARAANNAPQSKILKMTKDQCVQLDHNYCTNLKMPKKEPNMETKMEPKIVPRVESKLVNKVEPKIVSKMESKPVNKVEPKMVSKMESKPVNKVEPKIVSKMESKPVNKVEPKIVPNMESKMLIKMEPKLVPKMEYKMLMKIEPRMKHEKELPKVFNPKDPRRTLVMPLGDSRKCNLVLRNQPRVTNADGQVMVSLLKVNSIAPVNKDPPTQEKKRLQLTEYYIKRLNLKSENALSNLKGSSHSTVSTDEMKEREKKLLENEIIASNTDSKALKDSIINERVPNEKELMSVKVLNVDSKPVEDTKSSYTIPKEKKTMSPEVLNDPKAIKTTATKAKTKVTIPPQILPGYIEEEIALPPNIEMKQTVNIGVNTVIKFENDGLNTAENLQQFKTVLDQIGDKINPNSLITSMMNHPLTLNVDVEAVEDLDARENLVIRYMEKDRPIVKTRSIEVQTTLSLMTPSIKCRSRRRNDSNGSDDSVGDGSFSSSSTTYSGSFSPAGYHSSANYYRSRRNHYSHSPRSIYSDSWDEPYHSHSRSPSRAYSRQSSRPPSRPLSSRSDYDAERFSENEDRKVIYIGGISDHTKEEYLRSRFGFFGHIMEVKMRFRNGADNFAFITYRNKEDAYAAIDKGNYMEPHYHLSFGERRNFCGHHYSDLDNVHDDTFRYQKKPLNYDNTRDFNELLQEVKQQQQLKSKS